ncbi:MAG: hypothetical protein L0H55_09650 [Candidatus Nitrosocosmicus sp.]|nr:hypothetical protein [Candidatus Nitrosocosmicus sp.]
MSIEIRRYLEVDSKVQASTSQSKTEKDCRVHSGRDITQSRVRIHMAVGCNRA